MKQIKVIRKLLEVAGSCVARGSDGVAVIFRTRKRHLLSVVIMDVFFYRIANVIYIARNSRAKRSMISRMLFRGKRMIPIGFFRIG